MKACIFALTALLLAPLSILPAAELKLPSVFSDHAVLQRDMPVPVWGTAGAGDEISVEFAGQKKMAKADASGKWGVKLDAMPASAQPRELKVTGSTTPSGAITLKDVLVGEVWVGSGQSNMANPVAGYTAGDPQPAWISSR